MYLHVPRPKSAFLVLIIAFVATSSSLSNAHIGHNRLSRQTSCRRLEYTCANQQCIASYNVCDGATDCSDGSDETRDACSASGTKCPSLAFECAYGACIDRELRCDGKSDCADGSDEVGCSSTSPPTSHDQSCGSLKFKCSNGQCINRYDTCDGVKNCDDGTDETKDLCSSLVCPSISFQCDYGACLEPSVKCDGKSDCADDSDEHNCQPNNSPTSVPPSWSTSSPVGGCRLPIHPRFGAYTSLQCGANDPRPVCRNTPGTPTGDKWVLKYTCNSGYSLDKETEYSVCENGEWKNKLDCIKLCPPLKSMSVNVKCNYNGKEVSCNKAMRPNTSATAECKQYYQATYVPAYKYLYCLSTGEWSNHLFQCTPDCGVKQGSPTPLILHGTASRQGEFPWLAALYYLTGSQRWEQKCGGTLITPHMVLTAAHCLVDSQILLPSDIKVGLGKYYRDFYNNETSSLISDVRELVVPKQYAGGASHYALDIGLIDLVTSVQVTAYIMPACLDWSNMFKPAPGTTGVVAGWGTTENQTGSNVILSAQLSFIGYDQCLKMIRAAFKSLLTHDKFCGGTGANGGQVDKGDSGGGLTFVKNGLHFLIGIVSTKIPDESALFTLFTDITNSEHSTWLENQRRHLLESHRE